MNDLTHKSRPLALFDAQALTANQRGLLSTGQRWRYIGARLAEHLLGSLIATFLLVMLIAGFRLTLTLTALIFIVAFVGGSTLILFGLSILPAFGIRLKSVQGVLAKRVITPYGDWPQCAITIADVLFYVTPTVFDALIEDGVYQANYLLRRVRNGGNVLISAILLQPPDDQEEGEDDL